MIRLSGIIGAAVAMLASSSEVAAQTNLCPTSLERLVETRKEGNKTIHVCVCSDGYVRSASSKKCVRAKKLDTVVAGDVSVETWNGGKLDAKAIASAAADPKAASAVFAKGNTVKTGADGQFQMTLPDGETVSIESDSTLGFERIEFDSKGKIDRMIWRLQDGILHWEGEARTMIKRSAMEARYSAIAGNSHVVCGVRGTKFKMFVNAEAGGGVCWDVRCACHRPCEPSTTGYVDLYEGALDLFDKDGTLLMTMQPGQRVVFDSGGAPIGPTTIPQ